jgi:transcriptional regulator with XRE-family HTH domain
MIMAGAALKALREARGWRLYELADRSGVALGTLARLEQGGGRPKPETIARLAAALGLTPSALHRALHPTSHLPNRL